MVTMLLPPSTCLINNRIPVGASSGFVGKKRLQVMCRGEPADDSFN